MIAELFDINDTTTLDERMEILTGLHEMGWSTEEVLQ
jgi:hypothetical protein